MNAQGEGGDAAAALAGARVVQLEVPDLDGGLSAKLVSPEKALSDSGAAMCSIMFGLTLADDVYESPASSAANGYPDLVMRPDLTTLRPLPWCDATVAVLCDLFGADGAPFSLAPRTVLRTVVERCAGLGFEARFAAEWELCVVHRGDGPEAASRAGALVPLGRTMNAYSSLRLRELRPLAQDFFRRMEAVGIGVDSVHTELGHGMVEFALSHAPALEAADHAALHGIAEKLEPPDPATADAYADARFGRLPATLADAIATLRASPLAADLLGRDFVDHYLLSREVEHRLWREWESDQVTEWEQRRYFETS